MGCNLRPLRHVRPHTKAPHSKSAFARSFLEYGALSAAFVFLCCPTEPRFAEMPHLFDAFLVPIPSNKYEKQKRRTPKVSLRDRSLFRVRCFVFGV